jgi:hypothetical protein
MSPKRSSRCAVSRTQLVDAVMDGYVQWREESSAVAASHQGWRFAPRDERAIAFDQYVVALDREEQAALAYQRLIELAHAARPAPDAR